MRKNKVIYNPRLSIDENAQRCGVTTATANGNLKQERSGLWQRATNTVITWSLIR